MQNIAGCYQQTFENKKFVDSSQQCFAIKPKANFPTHNLNSQWRWRWWDGIQAIFLNLFYFNFSRNFRVKPNPTHSADSLKINLSSFPTMKKGAANVVRKSWSWGFFSVKSLHFTKLRMIDRQQRSKPLLLKASTSCVPQITKGRRNVWKSRGGSSVVGIIYPPWLR